jgi:hypothetical protein
MASCPAITQLGARCDQPRLVGIVLDGPEFDAHAVRRQHDAGPAHRELADPATDHAAADDDALRALPGLEAQEAANDGRQFARELLDHGVDEAGRHRIGARQHLVELGLGDFLHRHVSERILAPLLHPVAPVGQDGAEGAAAGAIADEAFLVAQFLVVGVDGDGGQDATAVDQDGGRGGRLIGGGRVSSFRLHAHAASPSCAA